MLTILIILLCWFLFALWLNARGERNRSKRDEDHRQREAEKFNTKEREAAMKYLVEQGMDPNQAFFKAYGYGNKH